MYSGFAWICPLKMVIFRSFLYVYQRVTHISFWRRENELRPKGRVSQEGVSSPPQLPFPKIRCLRILALAPQTEWMVILQMLGVEKWIVDLDCWDLI